MALTWLKEKPKSHNCLLGPTGQAPHSPDLCSSSYLTGFLRGGGQVLRSREPASRLPVFSSVLTTGMMHGPQAYLQLPSLFPPQLPGLTHLNSSTRSAGKEAPQVLEAEAGTQGAPRYSDRVPRWWDPGAGTCSSPGSGPSREGGESRAWLATMEGRAPRPMLPLGRALVLWSSLPHWVSVPAHDVCHLLPCCPPYLLQFACGSIPYCLEVLPRWPVLTDASSDQDISLYNPYPHLCDLCHFIYFFLCSMHCSLSKIGIFTFLFSLALC